MFFRKKNVRAEKSKNKYFHRKLLRFIKEIHHVFLHVKITDRILKFRFDKTIGNLSKCQVIKYEHMRKESVYHLYSQASS